MELPNESALPLASGEAAGQLSTDELPPTEAYNDEGVTLGSNVCDICIEDNLTAQAGIQGCKRCGNPFCIHYASKIDPICYCVDCMSDLTLTKETITKTYVHEKWDPKTDTTYQTAPYTRRARLIKVGGLDWLFAQRKILTLTDPELDMMIEYHRQLMTQIYAEADRRRTEKAHRYAGVKVVIPSASTQTTQTTTTTVTKKTTKTISSNKAQAKIDALMASLLASGMSQEDIMKAFGGGA